MYIEQLTLNNFRNYEQLKLNLNKNVTILYGNNAQGKTNLLESIYFIAIGRSYRALNDKELIMFNKNMCTLSAIANNNNIKDKIEINLNEDKRKCIFVNGVPVKKLGDLLGNILVVSFSPEDLQLIKSGPAGRRKFIDVELCQLSKVYYYDLKQYNHILKQRNNLLKKVKFDKNLKDTLFAFDSQLVHFGTKIMAQREKFIKELSHYANEIQSQITNEKEELQIIYKPSVTIDNYEDKLNKSIDKDILYGITSLGVHKDDVSFLINGIDVKKFGSQGQQRTASLSTKLAEIQIIKTKRNTTPILLLDDVLSELDKNRQEFLVKNIKGIQTIITCTGVEDFINNINGEVDILHVTDGTILTK